MGYLYYLYKYRYSYEYYLYLPNKQIFALFVFVWQPYPGVRTPSRFFIDLPSSKQYIIIWSFPSPWLPQILRPLWSTDALCLFGTRTCREAESSPARQSAHSPPAQRLRIWGNAMSWKLERVIQRIGYSVEYIWQNLSVPSGVSKEHTRCTPFWLHPVIWQRHETTTLGYHQYPCKLWRNTSATTY